MRRALRHPTAPTARTPPAPLTRKTAPGARARSPRTETARRRPRTRRTAGIPGTRARRTAQTHAVARLRGRVQEGLQMLADHLVEHGVLGVSRAIQGHHASHA